MGPGTSGDRDRLDLAVGDAPGGQLVEPHGVDDVRPALPEADPLHVREVDSSKDLSDEVRWMRFSNISWTKDSRGFFYSRYPEPPKGKVLEAALSGQALYYHRVGTPQSEDRLIYERKDLPGVCIFVDSPDHDAPARTETDQRLREELADLGFRVVVIRTDQELEKQVARYADVFGTGT